MRSFFILLLLTWVLNLIFPWWIGVFPALAIGAIYFNRWIHAFLIGFSGSGMAWFIQAFYIHVMNEGVLTQRIATMLQVDTPENVLLITFLVGGLIGGVAAVSGFLFKAALKPGLIHQNR